MLCIEAKIGAEENAGQLERYFERFHVPGKRFVGKLLTPAGGEVAAKGFSRLLWSDVADALLRFGASDAAAARSPFVGQLALQYAEFIRSHFRG